MWAFKFFVALYHLHSHRMQEVSINREMSCTLEMICCVYPVHLAKPNLALFSYCHGGEPLGYCDLRSSAFVQLTTPGNHFSGIIIEIPSCS